MKPKITNTDTLYSKKLVEYTIIYKNVEYLVQITTAYAENTGYENYTEVFDKNYEEIEIEDLEDKLQEFIYELPN